MKQNFILEVKEKNKRLKKIFSNLQLITPKEFYDSAISKVFSFYNLYDLKDISIQNFNDSIVNERVRGIKGRGFMKIDGNLLYICHLQCDDFSCKTIKYKKNLTNEELEFIYSIL